MCLTPDVEGNGMAYLPALIRAGAEHHRIPVALHLDHATELDQIKAAVDNGFTSVMIDGSRLPFDENAAITRAAVELAHPYGVSVEGELGHVGGMDLEATQCADSVLTEASEVAEFIEQTGVDALAVSVGTSHGVYQSLPNLAIDRLKELNQASSVPLVLHGGSGTPDDQIQEAVRNGICKLNIYADCRIAMGRGLQRAAAALAREDPTPDELLGPMKCDLGDVVADKIQLLFAENRAWTTKADQ
jgi:fructose-bisphosphate aldolase class II